MSVVAHQLFENEARRKMVSRLMVAKDQSIQEFMVQWAGIAVLDCMKWTPPRGESPGSESWNEQRKRGVNRIQSEVKKLYPPLESIHILKTPQHQRVARYVEKYIASKNLSALRTILNDFGIPVPLILEKATRESHEGARDNRGRVIPSIHYPVLDGRSPEKLAKEIANDVGKTKAGFFPAAEDLGRAGQVPNWIKRHNTPGDIQSVLHGPDKHITWRNGASTCKNMNPNKIIAPVMRALENKMRASLKAMMAAGY